MLDDIESNPRAPLLNNNFDEFTMDSAEPDIPMPADLAQPLKSSLKKSKQAQPIITDEPRRSKKSKHGPMMAPPGFPPLGPMAGAPMTGPPMWGYPPPPGPIPYKRRGDRKIAYRSGWNFDESDSDQEYEKDPSKVPGEFAQFDRLL